MPEPGQAVEKMKSLCGRAAVFEDVVDMLKPECKQGMSAYEDGQSIEVESLLLFALQQDDVTSMLKLLRKTLPKVASNLIPEKKIQPLLLQKARATLAAQGPVAS